MLILYLVALACAWRGADPATPTGCSSCVREALTALAAARLSAAPRHRLSTRLVLVADSVVSRRARSSCHRWRGAGRHPTASRWAPCDRGNTNTGHGGCSVRSARWASRAGRPFITRIGSGPADWGDAVRSGSALQQVRHTPRSASHAALQSSWSGSPPGGDRPTPRGWVTWSGSRRGISGSTVVLAPSAKGWPRIATRRRRSGAGGFADVVTDLGRSVSISRFGPAPLHGNFQPPQGSRAGPPPPAPARSAAAVIAHGDLPLEPHLAARRSRGVPGLDRPIRDSRRRQTVRGPSTVDGHPLGTCLLDRGISHTTGAGAPPPQA